MDLKFLITLFFFNLGNIKACKTAALKCEDLKFEQLKIVFGDPREHDVNKHKQNLERIKMLEHWNQVWSYSFQVKLNLVCARKKHAAGFLEPLDQHKFHPDQEQTRMKN